MTECNMQAHSFPRPIMERKNWMSLNGIWEFSFEEDSSVSGLKKYIHKELNMEICVPYCYQSEKSGIHDLKEHKAMRYRKIFELTKKQAESTVLLHFGAVDYEAYVWINHEFVYHHVGGFTYFHCDITNYVRESSNEIEVLVIDDCSRSKPRGKQFWRENPRGCMYTATSGIWRDVWLEFTGSVYLEQVKITPELDDNRAVLDIETNESCTGIEVEIFFKGKKVWDVETVCEKKHLKITADLEDHDFESYQYYWTPEIPNLHDVLIKTKVDGNITDTVHTYFGMRKIHIEDGIVYLNNQPYYQRLVLNQGYWKESLMTSPDTDALRRDVELIKAMGFNGVRVHQKIEDDRFYYLADKIGLLVWGEMPSAFEFNEKAMEATHKEITDFINQAYNHPSIITWVPLNESWGVRNIITDEQQQNYARSLYYHIKALDNSRLVNTNDGWEQLSESDICGIHDYIVQEDRFTEKYVNMDTILKGSVQGRKIYTQGSTYKNQPILISECGGVAFEGKDGWGYQNAAKSKEEYLKRLSDLVKGILHTPWIQGFCITQFTDVMQEVNGIVTDDRNPKVDLDKIREIITYCK